MPPVEITSLGEPKTVDPAAIEQELAQLWASAAEGETAHPVMRTCTLNLLVYLEGSSGVPSITAVTGRLTAQHPNRSIILIADPDSQPAELTAWVSAQCHLPRSGGKHVCCEQIIINAVGEQTRHLPGTAIPFLLPDLPVFLWWTDPSGMKGETFKGLSQVANRVIVDSAQFQHPKAQWSDLMSLSKENGLRLAYGDLNWSRLNPWREMIAQFFDSFSCLAQLHQVDRMIIECRSHSRKVSTIPAQPLLLAGWFTGRLGWKPLPVRHHLVGLRHHLHFEKAGSEFRLEICLTEEEKENRGEITSVKLWNSRRPGMEFRIRRTVNLDPVHNLEMWETVVQEEGKPTLQRHVAPQPLGDEYLLGDQLNVPGHDPVFEEAWKTAMEISYC
jgi:glucose-6-phosphate dehydrogenase assembly protein OpcA